MIIKIKILLVGKHRWKNVSFCKSIVSPQLSSAKSSHPQNLHSTLQIYDHRKLIMYNVQVGLEVFVGMAREIFDQNVVHGRDRTDFLPKPLGNSSIDLFYNLDSGATMFYEVHRK